MLAFLDPPEIILIVVVILVLFGGSQLPKLAKNLGKAQKEFKDIYYSMGSLFEAFENVPRAYTRLRWAIDVEHKQYERDQSSLSLAV